MTIRSNTNLDPNVSMGNYGPSFVSALFTNECIEDTYWPTQTVSEKEGRNVIDKEIKNWLCQVVYQVFQDNNIKKAHMGEFNKAVLRGFNNRRHIRTKVKNKNASGDSSLIDDEKRR